MATTTVEIEQTGNDLRLYVRNPQGFGSSVYNTFSDVFVYTDKAGIKALADALAAYRAQDHALALQINEALPARAIAEAVA